MLTRRDILRAGLLTGAGWLLPWRNRASAALLAETGLLDPFSQPKFVNPLPNPLDPSFIFQPTTLGGMHYEIGVRQFQQSLGLIDPASGSPLLTTVWGYGNAAQPPTFPGRTFVVERDQSITVRWSNDLVGASGVHLPHLFPVDTTVHWANPLGESHGEHFIGPVPVVAHLHGGHTRSDSDGLPDAWFTPNEEFTGRLWNPLYTYDNDQEAATLWYHDHALGITRLNVYAGLAGFYLLRDSNETALGLPQFPYEVPIVIQDRMFTADGQLFYPSEPEEDDDPEPSVLPEFFGNIILVNGQAWPVLEVEPRKYRFRFLNGSDSRFYTLWISSGGSKAPSGPAMVQIGTDSGFLYSPVGLDKLTLGPGERADVVVDFAAYPGQTLILHNNARAPFPMGETVNRRAEGLIMAFRVGSSVTSFANNDLPTTLRSSPIAPLVQSGPTRRLLLFEGTDEYGRLQPGLGTTDQGALRWEAAITEYPRLNDVEVWEVYNTTEDAHPIHLHLVSFQIFSRQKFRATQNPLTGALTNIRWLGQPKPPAANEAGWKDTAQMFPGEVTRLIARFDRLGEYVWHCHILSHEDHEMMRPYSVLASSA